MGQSQALQSPRVWKKLLEYQREVQPTDDFPLEEQCFRLPDLIYLTIAKLHHIHVLAIKLIECIKMIIQNPTRMMALLVYLLVSYFKMKVIDYQGVRSHNLYSKYFPFISPFSVFCWRWYNWNRAITARHFSSGSGKNINWFFTIYLLLTMKYVLSLWVFLLTLSDDVCTTEHGQPLDTIC